MSYLPPEGFSPYPGSHLYYRSDTGADPQTGAPCQWVTYFDPEQGTYHQVAYPLPEPTPPPVTPPPQAAAAPPGWDPQSPPPAPRKKGKGGRRLLVLLLLLLAAGLTLWLTGAYTKIPILQDWFSPPARFAAVTPRPDPSPTPSAVPSATSAPSATPVPAPKGPQAGSYILDLPDYDQAVLLVLDPEETFYLEAGLGGDIYSAYGDYRVEDNVLYLEPVDDYYQEAMGDLTKVRLDTSVEGTLTLLAPDHVLLLKQGQSLTLSPTMIDTGDIPLSPELSFLLDQALTTEMLDQIENSPSLSAFPTGIYLRADGQALMLLNGADYDDSFFYLLCALPGPNSGARAEAYFTTDGSSYCMADVSGTSAQDSDTNLTFSLGADSTIQVTSNWSEEEYISYEAPDGNYRRYQ